MKRTFLTVPILVVAFLTWPESILAQRGHVAVGRFQASRSFHGAAFSPGVGSFHSGFHGGVNTGWHGGFHGHVGSYGGLSWGGWGWGWGFGIGFGWPYWLGYAYPYGYPTLWPPPSYFYPCCPPAYPYHGNRGDDPPPSTSRANSNSNSPSDARRPPAGNSPGTDPMITTAATLTPTGRLRTIDGIAPRQSNHGVTQYAGWQHLSPRKELLNAARALHEMPPFARQREIDHGRYSHFSAEDREFLKSPDSSLPDQHRSVY